MVTVPMGEGTQEAQQLS
jgi:hypothetical protein